MTRHNRQFGSAVTFASLVIMLCIQTMHSPLSHVGGCCEVASHQHGTCEHSHKHGRHEHSHTEHSHTHAQTSESPVQETPSCPHEDCQLCQFLAQHFFETQLPVALIGGESVEICSEQASSLFVEPIALNLSVRGPPSA